jgi:Lon protease-like protein
MKGSPAMSDLLPLFPLPNVVLFPNVFLPLHIFEPRYRDMVSDAVATDRLIGMVLLRPGWQDDYDGRPPIYPIGCSGVITHVERLADGRFNIVLRGMERFRVLSEDQSRSYRRALVQPLDDPRPTPADAAAHRRLRARLELLLAAAERPGGSVWTDAAPEREAEEEHAGEARIPASMPDEDLVNALAQYLDLEPLERQALLEQDALRARAEALVELLEMKTMMARSGWTPHVAH